MNLSKKQIKTFQRKIFSWYEKNKRDLPWRHPSLKLRNGKFDPYKILVSEVMSQQTQLSRVVPKYLAWIDRFPTLESLAEAHTRDILAYWSGLGYNRRALYLQKLAKTLCHSGEQSDSSIKGKKDSGRARMTVIWPTTEKELRQLPGIGEYTARAILCFAFDKQMPVVDTNIRKVIAVHFFKGEVPNKKIVEEVAQQLLPKGKAYEWNQALMDYAAAELKNYKILLPKQSKFKDSDRYYRGQIIKLLTVQEKITLKALYRVFAVQKERLEKILLGLEKDGLVVRKRQSITMP